MRINARRTFWGVQKKSVRELVVYLNLKHNQKMSRSKDKLEEIESDNVWLQEQLDQLYKSDLNTFSPEQKATFIERVNMIEKFTLPTKQLDDFMPHLKKTLFGLNSEKVKAHIKQLKMFQSVDLDEVQEQLDRLISQRNIFLDKLRPYREKQRTEHVQEVQGKSAKQIEQPTRRSAQLNAQRTIQTADDQRVQTEQPKLPDQRVQPDQPGQYNQRVRHEQPDQYDQRVQRDQPDQYNQRVQPEHPDQYVAHDQHVPLQNATSIKQQVPVSTSTSRRLTKEVSSFWEEDIEYFLAGFGTAPTIEGEQQRHTYSGDTWQRDTPEMGRERHNAVLHEPVGARKSVAITDQGAYLRQKYIVGKMVGKDLKDNRGKLIARQDTQITEQVLISAEQEGKLAELIVHMKLQQLGD